MHLTGDAQRRDAWIPPASLLDRGAHDLQEARGVLQIGARPVRGDARAVWLRTGEEVAPVAGIDHNEGDRGRSDIDSQPW